MKKVLQPASVDGVWRLRDKKPEDYPFTPDGNIRAVGYTDPKTKQSVPEKIYTLQAYRKANKDELETLWAQREEGFDPIYEKIEAARAELRQAILDYQGGTGTARGVVQANLKVGEAEAELVMNRSPQRWIEQKGGLSIKEVELDNKYEERKLPFDIFELKGSGIKIQDYYVAAAPGEAMQGGSLEVTYKVITDESVLGLHWPADIQVEKTKYFTLFQAILGELAKSQGNEPIFESILGTRSSRTLRTLSKDWKKEEYSSDIIQKVLEAAIQQIPDFKETLLKTEDQTLLYANVMDQIFSIGMAPEELDLGIPKEWRGDNIWGEELMKARTALREKTVTKKPEDEGQKDLSEAINTVISKEEQKAAKVGAIINAKRRRHY